MDVRYICCESEHHAIPCSDLSGAAMHAGDCGIAHLSESFEAHGWKGTDDMEGVMHPLIETQRARILALAKRHGLQDVRVFGSMARGDADDASDVDLLVSLAPNKTGLALGALLVDLEELLDRRVEVLTEGGLHSEIRDQVLKKAQPL